MVVHSELYSSKKYEELDIYIYIYESVIRPRCSMKKNANHWLSHPACKSHYALAKREDVVGLDKSTFRAGFTCLDKCRLAKKFGKNKGLVYRRAVSLCVPRWKLSHEKYSSI